MNREDIEKLIGGYASGTLTVEERRQLFAAALEHQDLFDALQEEVALKELLDDPVSREQIHRAVVDSLPQPKPAWFKQTWFWAAGTSLAAAAVLLAFLVQWKPIRDEMRDVAVLQRNAPAPAPAPSAAPTLRDEKSVARLEAPKPEAPKPAQFAPRQSTLKKEESRSVATPAAAPPPTPTPEPAIIPASPPVTPVQAENRNQTTEQVTVQQAQSKDSAQSATSAGVQQQPEPVSAFRSQAKAKSVGAPAGALLAPQLAMRGIQPWSVAKRLTDGSYVNVPPNTIFQPGDTIRIAITPRLSGPVELLQLDANTAAWQRIYPPPGLTIQVQAQEQYTVPLDIHVKNNDRLRITVGSTAIDIPIRTGPQQ